MKKSKKQVSAKSELLLAASLCADIGKGLILALVGALILGRIGPNLGGVLAVVIILMISIVLLGFSFFFTRQAAIAAESEKESQ